MGPPELNLEILAKLQCISEQLERQASAAPRRACLRSDDRLALATLFPAIEQAFPAGVDFTASELIKLARDDTTVRTALEQLFGRIDGGTARRIGKLFRRATSFEEAGFRVERLADTRAGVLWVLKRV